MRQRSHPRAGARAYVGTISAQLAPSFIDLPADGRLSADEERILTLLGLLGGAAVSPSHVEAVAGVAEATPVLASLASSGWVQSASGRYRLVRSSSSCAAAQLLVGKLTTALLEHMIEFARDEASTPATLLADIDAVDATLRLAALDGRWTEVLELALASEAKLAHADCSMWRRRVLRSGLEAAQSLGDEHAEAHILHQLGSVALRVGETGEAAVYLQEALLMRERISDLEGAERTRHNIRELGAGGPFWGGRGAPPPVTPVGAQPSGEGTVLGAAIARGRVGGARRLPWPALAFGAIVVILVFATALVGNLR
jgi:hypothetical protein